ncbi:MAG: rhodanese family protein [Hyphomonas sp.]|uniref:rhodanese family protein n=1 Tax=Hyphomonas sp. TaxID=87 RepID=UPI0034A0130B
MSTLTKIDPKTVADGLKAGRFHLIDIREPEEYAREHIGGAVSIPLSSVEQANVKLEAGRTAVFHCKSGMRTEANCSKLAARVEGDACILEGGLDAWKKAGLPVKDNAKAPLPMHRQVQITAGSLVLAGVLIATFVHPAGYVLSGFIGAGLIFAGVSGWCGMANVLAAMPGKRTA